MKCPKCGYLGFETSDRCRNCGYDFSLSFRSEEPELPLRDANPSDAPPGDFDLDRLHGERTVTPASVDLDRLIGDESAEPPRGAPRARPSVTPGLPLFSRDDDQGEPPMIAAPRPARPPLAVRRTSPEIPRGRSAPAVTPRQEDTELLFQIAEDGPSADEPSRAPVAPATETLAGGLARAGAATIDLVLLGAINAAVIYLTLAIAGLTRDQIDLLPILPLATFSALLCGGYLIAFTAASGQTIGKMITGIRVIGDDDRRVDVAGAVLRALGCGASLLTVGLGYLPAFVTADRRALQDRIASTRVVRAR